MRKLAFLVMVALLAIGGFSTQAQATGEQLTDLASYYDAETTIYASVRTDDAFFQELDTLFENVKPFLPESERPPFGLIEALNQQLASEGLDPLDESILPWLGDAAAIGILGFPADMSTASENDIPLYATIRIDDRDAAAAYLETVLADDENAMQTDEINGFTIYTLPEAAQDNPGYIALGDEILFLASSNIAQADLPFDGAESSLSDTEAFTDVMNSLPAENYNATVYVATARLQEATLAAAEAADNGGQMPAMFEQLSSATVAQAIGATVLDGRSLTIDVAQRIDPDVLAEFGFEPADVSPVDPDFATRIPADAPLVIHSADFGPSTLNAIESLRNFDAYVAENGGWSQLLGDFSGGMGMLSDDEAALLDAVNASYLLAPLNITFSGLTGLSLERDVLPVLDGDSALYLRLLPTEDFFLSPVLPDVGMLFQSSTNETVDIAQSIVDASEAYETNYPVEEYGEGAALVINLISEQFNAPQLDLLVAGTDGLLALGTRPAVEAALDTSGGLVDSDAFQDASAFFLEDSEQVLYLNSEPLLTLAQTLIEGQPNLATEENIAMLRLLSIVDTASITGRTSDDNSLSVGRMTLTLSDAPIEIEMPTTDSDT